jgi:hypothetical protein
MGNAVTFLSSIAGGALTEQPGVQGVCCVICAQDGGSTKPGG